VIEFQFIQVVLEAAAQMALQILAAAQLVLHLYM
jgi:hypothetical protein